MSEPRKRDDNDRLCDDESARRWIERHLATAPRLSGQQLREIGQILGLTLVPRRATRE